MRATAKGRFRKAGASPAHPGATRWPLAVVLVSVLAAAAQAWEPYATVTSRPGGRFQDPDAAFHARRAERAIAAGSLLPPVFDAFENFPEGGRAVWPPLHDATLALAARLGGSTPASPARGMTTAAAFPVVELALAVLAAAALASGLSGYVGAAAAAVIFAAMPTVVQRGAFGEIDHNMTEILGALVLLLVATWAASPARRGTSGFFFAASAWAATILMMLGYHSGLLLSAGVAGAAALAGSFLEGKGSAAPLAAGFGLAAASLPFFARLRVAPDPGDPWRLGPVYALALALAGAGVGLVVVLGSLAGRPGDGAVDRRHETLLAAGGTLLSVATLVLLPRPAWAGLVRGIGFLGARDPWLASIQEFQPVWTNPDIVIGAMPGLLVAPVALAAAIFSRPGRAKAGQLAALTLPLAAFAVLGVFQQRFLPLAAAFAAAAGGGAFGLLRMNRLRALAAVALLAGCAAAGPMAGRALRGAWRGEPETSLTAPELAAVVLRDVTPDPGDPPAWGVLASWDYGHPILFGSGRAVALNNFGSWHLGFEEKLRLLVETSPRRAADTLTRLRLRYVVASFPPPILYGIARALGQSELKWIFDSAAKSEGLYAGTPEGERTLLFRLHKRDASPLPDDGPEDRAAARRFRKVWESPERTPETGPLLKIFEVLPEVRP